MNHPELGELLPGAFLPAAEESGLILPLGEWIIREALATAHEWPDHLTLSLNISPAQFQHGDIAETIATALAKTGMQGARLRLEISESVFQGDQKRISAQLGRLKGTGATIVLDDFGLSRSSLMSLSSLPCDAVKLDKSLIERVGEEPEIESLVRSLIGTAQSFDLKVQAEGIERVEQAHFLMSNDCQNVQGYLFGRPAHVGDLAAIIAKDMRKSIGEGNPGARPAQPGVRSVA